MASQKANIALVDLTGLVPFGELQTVGAALQIQVTRDFAPVWAQDATLQVFRNQAEIPAGFWPIVIVEQVDVAGVDGYHWIDDAGKPYAQVEYRDGWSITASHELLEMLANPYVNRTKLVKALDETGQEVEVLVEVSDPVESKDFGYKINGVLVSNFYYPAFFDFTKTEGKKYDHLGWLTEPRKLLNGGYISWRNAAGEWWQAFMVDNALIYRKLGDQTPLTTAQKTKVWVIAAASAVLVAAIGLLINYFRKRK